MFNFELPTLNFERPTLQRFGAFLNNKKGEAGDLALKFCREN
jgi:hypothetical protein